MSSLSTAAHELRTPLTTIRMAAGLAHEQLKLKSEESEAGQVDPRVLDLINLVVEGSERMQSLVNDLLDLTRLEQGRTTLQMEDLDLRDVVKASAEATRPLFDSKGQHLSMHLPEAYCSVRGDKQRLEQVLLNLLSNAHKYSPSGSRVAIRVTRAGSECVVSVRDNGPGVPAEDRRGYLSASTGARCTARTARLRPGWGCLSRARSPRCTGEALAGRGRRGRERIQPGSAANQ